MMKKSNLEETTIKLLQTTVINCQKMHSYLLCVSCIKFLRINCNKLLINANNFYKMQIMPFVSNIVGALFISLIHFVMKPQM